MAAAETTAQKKEDIASLVATLASRQAEQTEKPTRVLTGPERAAVHHAGARRTIWRQDLEPARRRRTAPAVDRDVDARHDRFVAGRKPAARIRRPAFGVRLADGQLRRHRTAAAAIPAARARRRRDGRNPRPRRPQHVGEALQRPGRGARELPQERISADHRRGALENPARTCRPRAGDPAGRTRARRRQPHAAHGSGAEGRDRARRADACAPNSCPTSRRPAAATRTR